jgi:hypothetical protein
MVEPKREETTGSWKKLHNLEFYNLFSSPNIIVVIKPTRIGWARNVAALERQEINTKL